MDAGSEPVSISFCEAKISIMALDLKKLEKEFDGMLKSTTKEDFQKWLLTDRAMEDPKVLVYVLVTPDGHEMISFNRHDFKTYKDANGKEYMIDGGRDYCRRSANGDEKVITVTNESDHDLIRKYFHWGSRGKDGKQPLKYISLEKIKDDHLKAIIDTQERMSNWLFDIFAQELIYRELV